MPPGDANPLVLIVEDDPSVRAATARALRSRGYAIVEARDGEEAIARVAQQVPAVIVLDLMLPGMDGHEVLRQLASKKVASVVVVVSAVLTTGIAAALTGGAVVACLAKPYVTAELAAALARAVEVFKVRSRAGGTSAPG